MPYATSRCRSRYEWPRATFAAILCQMFPIGRLASDDEAGWTAATEEPSRGELFEVFEAARISFAFPARFRFPDDAVKDRDGEVRTERIFGIDVSRYQGADFPVSDLRSHDIRFVYAKATQGVRIKDVRVPHAAEADAWPLSESAHQQKSFVNGVGITSPEQVSAILDHGQAWIIDLNPKDTRLELPDPQTSVFLAATTISNRHCSGPTEG